MPYRRLPNTDNARIRALRAAIDMNRPPRSKIISPNAEHLETLLRNIELAQNMYKDSLAQQARENQKLQKHIKTARLYISHFVQVLNFCILRHEIKKEVKALYRLDADNNSVPDISTNELLLLWGERIIEGERKRLEAGGTPIYNPTIARVNVAYSQFRSAYNAQKSYQQATQRQLEALAAQRKEIDEVLFMIWNEVEAFFAFTPENVRYEKCSEYGVIYYLRRNEKPASDKNENTNDN